MWKFSKIALVANSPKAVCPVTGQVPISKIELK